MTPQIILLDGSAFLFRAYFSTQSQGLTNQEGFPTGAIFGVISSIKQLQAKYPTAKIVAIFDHKGKNFRHDIYPLYKANRKPAEPDLILQIEPLYEVIKALGLPFLCVEGVEADDVIASLSIKAKKENISTLIASSDKDLYQLIGDCVYQLDLKGKLMDSQAVIDKMGVEPTQILDFLSLTGDSSDNIPGVPSVGPKTAVKWLQAYGDIAGIKKNAGQIAGKVGQKLRDNFESLDLSTTLVRLKTDIQTQLAFNDCDAHPDEQSLINLYQKYDFKQWLKQIQTKQTKPIETITGQTLLANYQQEVILSWGEFEHLIGKIKQAKQFVFDTETTSLNYMNAQLVGLVFLLDKTAYYLPVSHRYLGAPKQLDTDQVLQRLKPIFEDKSIGKIGQNLKYDAHILANYQINLMGIIADTMLASYCLNSTATLHNMDDLSAFYLHYKTIKFSQVSGRGKKQLSFDQVPLEKASEYACEDVIVTSELNQVLSQKLQQTPRLAQLYLCLELPLIPVLVNIERCGVLLDTHTLASQQANILLDIKSLQQQAYDIAQTSFNLDSPKQVRSILFEADYLNLEPKKTTPGGQASTNEEALKSLDHPLATVLLDYRMRSKLNSTYLEALPKQINEKTGRVHTSYHQAGTATGRLSSSNPNLQNIPIRTQDGARIRQGFVAKAGYCLLAADYSQIELRIMAHLSGDQGLLSAFNQGLDVHKATASQIFNKPISAVSDDNRRHAKAINFGLMYGMGAFSLAKQIKVSRTQAKQYIEQYFAQYPKVKHYVEQIQDQAKQQEFVQTMLGRRLYLPDINAKNNANQQHALRLAINAPMQGSSADIIKQAMLDIHHWIAQDTPPVHLLMQVHDELVFEVKNDFIEQAKTKINTLMTNAAKLSIPLVVDIGIGDNWQQAH